MRYFNLCKFLLLLLFQLVIPRLYGQQLPLKTFSLAADHFATTYMDGLQIDWRLDLGLTAMSLDQSSRYQFTAGFLQPTINRFTNDGIWKNYNPSIEIKNTFSGDDLRRRQYTFGMSLEDLELILHPMAEDAKEAIGSMGDDTPLAVLSDKYRPLYHFFRQNFSQVTNPPIDSLRENKVMSLKTRFGNLGNILDFDNLTKQNIYVLNSPILSNSQFDKFINFFGKNSLVILYK